MMDDRERQARRRGSRERSVYSRRRLFALGALLAAAALVVGAVAAIRGLRNGGEAQVASEAPPAKTVTIPEGYDRSQIAEIAKQADLRGDYLKASESFKGFDPAEFGAQSPESLEGFLFPATYELPRRPTADDLVARQLTAFEQNVSQVDTGYARSKNLTTYDLLIIGSMIDREVQVPKERELVAAVIYNRLQNDMPLQIDATVRFASGNFFEPISPSELQIDSPYNTYENPGLPPGPIGNPGLASIEAAARPAQVPYLYYVVKPNTCGEHTFATTEAEFNEAKAAYDEARAANGGNAPTPADCP
ncbi:MAG: endolytic transglycosylase MltG [Actinomycetota bacterium]